MTHCYAVISWLLSLLLFWRPLRDLVDLSLRDERSSHVLVIPFLSIGLICLRHKRLFCEARFCPTLGSAALLLTGVLWIGVQRLPLSTADRLSAAVGLVILAWLAGFVLFYGTPSFRASL